MWTETTIEKLLSPNYSINYLPLVEPHNLLSCSQKHITSPSPGLHQSCPHSFNLFLKEQYITIFPSVPSLPCGLFFAFFIPTFCRPIIFELPYVLYVLFISFTDLSTYLLNSMWRSFSWEANRFLVIQEIPRILWNAKVHFPLFNLIIWWKLQIV